MLTFSHSFIHTRRLRSFSLKAFNQISNYKSTSTNEFSVESLPDETLYIIDGTSFLFNAYHSTERKSDFNKTVLPLGISNTTLNNLKYNGQLPEDFANTTISGGTLAAMAMQFARFIRDVKPRYVAVAFDASRRNFRHELYPEYKSKRAPVSPDLIIQSI